MGHSNALHFGITSQQQLIRPQDWLQKEWAWVSGDAVHNVGIGCVLTICGTYDGRLSIAGICCHRSTDASCFGLRNDFVTRAIARPSFALCSEGCNSLLHSDMSFQDMIDHDILLDLSMKFETAMRVKGFILLYKHLNTLIFCKCRYLRNLMQSAVLYLCATRASKMYICIAMTRTAHSQQSHKSDSYNDDTGGSIGFYYIQVIISISTVLLLFGPSLS